MYVEAQTGKSFADVAGQDEAKEALMELVDFYIILRNIRLSEPICQRCLAGWSSWYR